MKLDCKFHTLKRDRTVIPEWAKLISRWHQLDDESYLVAEACFLSKEFIGNPELIYFSSKDGSNPTDSLFVKGAKFSPSNFVHTLPNVRSLSLSLVLEWEGRLLCNSLGNNSLDSCLNLAMVNLSSNINEVLIVNISYEKDYINIDFLKMTRAGYTPWSVMSIDHSNNITDNEILESLKKIKGITTNTVEIRNNNEF